MGVHSYAGKEENGMYSQKDASSEHAKAMRKKAGTWLKKLRERAELTQRDLATRVGWEYYTFVSQIEAGKGRVPPQMYEAYADTLGVDVQDFTKKMLMFYDPFTYKLLFGQPTKRDLEGA
jgi:transcriptional regulator with XRE-family HTH domain